jgi:hypothetical protein
LSITDAASRVLRNIASGKRIFTIISEIVFFAAAPKLR